jgi:hypothetical protein
MFMPVTIRYQFSQNFAVSQKQAYLWCTDFTPQDPQLLGYVITERQVVPLSEGLILLTDVLHVEQRVVEKQKLVHLYPDKFSWVLTHITGQTKYSQFRYEILTDPNGCCHLNYEALHVEHEKDCLTSDEKLQLTKTLYQRDLNMWRLLAASMEQELK